MGNAATIVLSYRLNMDYKEKRKKKNICNYLYGQCYFKNVSCSFTSDSKLRKKESGKDIQGSISRRCLECRYRNNCTRSTNLIKNNKTN